MKKHEGNETEKTILMEIRDMFGAFIREQRRMYRVAELKVKAYTGAEVEKMFGIKTRQLARWRKEGRIKFIKKGGQALYPKKQIDKLFDDDE